MKKLLALMLAMIMVLSLAACTGTPTEPTDDPTAPVEPGTEPGTEPTSEIVTVGLDGWDETVKAGLNDFMLANGIASENYDEENKPYVVFDFDNTCSIFDVEEQLAVYQLQTMTFAFTPEELPAILRTELGDNDEGREGYALDEAAHSYNDWIADIVAAYTYLYETYGPFTAAGLDEAAQAEIQADAQWAEFATKMRAMYDLVYDNESASVAYPWVLYWFTGMTEDEVYALATGSHSTYKAVETSTVTWTSPAEIESKVGQVEYEWTSGTQVSDNVVELWKALDANGIDVYVCSASATDPIRAAVDVWGMREYCKGVVAMTNTLVDGKYVNSYDYENGCMWLVENGEWVRDTTPTEAQTQGIGKVTAIENALVTKYGYGPIAGFMDSTGDFNFCTEFDSLQLVLCFNRASRKTTDGGGIASIAAVYEADNLGYDFAAAQEAGDIYFLLQGRDETGMRTLSGTRETLRYGKDAPMLFANDDVVALYNYVVANNMTVEELINRFAVKTAADAEGNDTGIKYGCVSTYDGYKQRKYNVDLEGWDATVAKGINDFVAANGMFSENYDEENKPYVVFDFDNTCSIFDVEEQLAVYQLQTMTFAFTPEELPAILRTELGDNEEPREGYALDEAAHSYNDWIADIVAAYTYLYETYGPFTAAGLDEASQAKIQADAQWVEFSTKMRAMYDLVYDNESASVAYPWVLYWFTGMTEDEVYALASGSHNTYKAVETSTVTWTSPAEIESKVGQVEYEWTSGTQVSDNVVELWQVLDSNGIDVYVCSASATDPIRAAVDAWDMRDYCKGVIAMTNTLVDGKYVNSYDYTNGCMWLVDENGEWVRDTAPIKDQTQGHGKVVAIQNALVSKYGYGPIAGFMDSTGDFNFCTEFDSLQLVICFNRASRKVTDGGGIASIAAVYEADNLGYDFAAAQEAGDIYFLLQGRDETGMRTLSGTRETLRYGKDAPMLFANDDVVALYDYVVANNMTVEELINRFAVKTAADAEGNDTGMKYGCVSEYAGYQNIK